MRQVLCPVLVGRSDELRVLLEALDGAVAGRGATAVVVGDLTDIPGAKPAGLMVGPYRASSQNDVLLP